MEDFERILTATDACLTRQYQALLETEQVKLEFTDDGIRRLAEIAFEVNERTENIGARRLHTVMEKLLEDISFDAGSTPANTWSTPTPSPAACPRWPPVRTWRATSSKVAHSPLHCPPLFVHARH